MASTGEAVLVEHRDGTVGQSVSPLATRIRAWVDVAPKLLVAASILALIARGGQRFATPGLFAEDGTIFIADAHNHGLAALWHPYAGYLHLIPRAIAAALDLAPLTWLPALYAVAGLAAYVALCAPVLSARIDWILPTPLARSVAFALLCVLPGTLEPYGNVANLIFVGGITMFLLAFSKDPRSRRWVELVAVAALGLSGPLVAIFAPFFWLRWGRNRSTHSALLAGVASVTAAIQTALTALTGRSTPGGGSLPLLWEAFTQRVGGGWLFGYLDVFASGDVPVADALAPVWVLVAFAVTVLAVRAAAASWLLAALLMGSAVWAYGAGMASQAYAYQRHVMVPMAIVVTLLVAAAWRGRPAARIVAAACLLAGASGIVQAFEPPPYGIPTDMAALEACVDTGQVCAVPTFDGDWTITLRPAR